MSLWLDFLGTEIRYVQTPTYGRVRIAEAGRGNPQTIIFQHGLNGHLEAYAKNLIPLSERFHVIAFDYVGHGLSDKKVAEYNPAEFAEQLRELMDALNIASARTCRANRWADGSADCLPPSTRNACAGSCSTPRAAFQWSRKRANRTWPTSWR